jgi:vitamin B12 transporter
LNRSYKNDLNKGMLIKGSLTTYITFFIALSASAEKASENNDLRINADILPSLTVVGQKTANQRPVTTYETPISNLDFDPRVDFQSRNMAEAQGDVSIRGGIFEETGFQVGSATLLDPQTGHYSTEIPIAPEMLGEPKVLTGADNAHRGFNSSAGTVSYSWREITKGGSVTLGGGDHNLNFQRLHNAWTGVNTNNDEWTWGVEMESSHSESDGTIRYGDHRFARTSGRIQLVGPSSQTDLFAGYQEKFFGLPAMYTGNDANLETEDLLTRLIFVNHSQQYGNGSEWELSSFYRRHSDQFILRRDNPSYYLADHETEVTAIAISGFHKVDERFSVHYNSQYTEDKINSLGLGQGAYNSRTYYKLSLLPQYIHRLNKQEIVMFKAGASIDDSNRDESKFSPIAEISWQKNDDVGSSERLYLAYAQATQVLGYSAIGGAKSSPFISDPNLRRGVSKNLELGYHLERDKWKLIGAVFHRWNKDLVDWLYTSSSARSAKHVDVNTIGVEIIASRQWNNFEAIGSYSYLHKNEDYGDSNLTRSLYTLNFPEHRATLGFIWKLNDFLEIRIDNEWREQKENEGRDGPTQSTYSHLAASYYPTQIDDLEVFIAFEKPWDEDFQDIPGTPGRGDQFSLGATYRW